MHALAGQRIEIRRHGRNEGFTFTRRHLTDSALMQSNTAENLNVKVVHIESTLCRFSHHGKSVGQNIVQRLALRQSFFKPGRNGFQLCVGLGCVFVCQRFDFLCCFFEKFKLLFVIHLCSPCPGLPLIFLLPIRPSARKPWLPCIFLITLQSCLWSYP